MKNIISGLILLALVSCNDSKEVPNMPGAYLMTSQTLNNGKTDTKYTTLKQLKIYTENFFMYTQVNPADSVSTFGVGSYTADKGVVNEHRIYNSSDTTYTTGEANFKLNITKTPDGYEQVIPEIVTDSVKYKLTELYQAVGTSKKSPLDGVWKETNSYSYIGKDTTKNIRTQYKAFFDGYFMFGHTVTDSLSRHRTGIGFGTFEMVNDTTAKETDLNSTYSIIAGNTFNVHVEMNGTDSYKQTIQNGDGSTGVEYYERLK